MKIAIFSDHFYPELGGIQDSLVWTIPELSKRGHEILVVAAKAPKKDFQLINLPEKEIQLGESAKIWRLPSFFMPSPTQQTRIAYPTFRRWKKIKEFRPDIVHSHTFWSIGLEAALAAKHLKVPFVGTNHWALTEFGSYVPVKKEWFKKVSLNLVNWYYNKCDFVTAPSQSVFDEMLKGNFQKSHKVISNPIDSKIFNSGISYQKSDLKRKFNISDNTVIYAGRIAVEKSIDVAIRAIAEAKKEIRDINLVIAGHGKAETSLKKLVKDLDVEDNVKFLGTLDKATLAQAFFASEMFVLMSQSETQSMVLLQAMACGIPALCVNWRAFPEYIKDGENGFLIAPKDSNELAKKIVSLFKDSQKRTEMGENAALSVQKYSIEQVASEWENVYKGLIKNS